MSRVRACESGFRGCRCRFTLHDHAARVLLLGSPIKHLALITQRVTPLHQVINLLPTLQDGFDGLVQDDLGLVEFFLDLHDSVRLGGVLVLGQVLLEGRFEFTLLCRGEAARGRQRGSTGRAAGPGGRELRDESGLLVQDLGDQRESWSVRVFQVGDHHACQACFTGCRGGPEDVCFVRVFFDRGGGVGGGSFGYGLGKEPHKLSHTPSLIKAKAAQVVDLAEDGRGGGRGRVDGEEGDGVDLHGGDGGCRVGFLCVYVYVWV